MAVLHSSNKSSILSSSSSSSQNLNSRLVLLLTLLPVSLAAFAFVLQWRGGPEDPTTRFSPDRKDFSFKISTEPVRSLSSSDCVNVLARTNSASFPYFRGWNFSFGSSDLRPKVRVLIGLCYFFLLIFFLLINIDFVHVYLYTHCEYVYVYSPTLDVLLYNFSKHCYALTKRILS